MHWVAPSEKDALTGRLEKRLWDSADQFRTNSGLKAQEYSGPILGINRSCISRLLTEVIEPYQGRILDPACGLGGMFVSFFYNFGTHAC